MTRGQRAEVGDETTNRNGYTYVRTVDRGWVAKHQLVLEEHIGRQLLPGEYVRFKSNNKQDLSLDNIELRRKGDNKTSIASRLAAIDARIEELQAEKELLLKEQDASLQPTS